MQEEYPMQFRFRCAAVLTAVLLCSAAALPALAEETATPETADSVSTYTGWKTVNGKDYWYENGVKQGTTGRGKEIYDPDSDAGTGWTPTRAAQKPSIRMSTRNPTAANGCATMQTAI